MASEIPTHVFSHYARTFIPTHFTRYYVDILRSNAHDFTYIREISFPNLDRETIYPE